MSNVVANFTNGKTFEIKNSKAEHKFAWFVEYTDKDGCKDFQNGFSSTKEGARKALDAAAKIWDKKTKKYSAKGVIRVFEEIVTL